jgi:SP family arabinose:H+ symporter-like MFS transporter
MTASSVVAKVTTTEARHTWYAVLVSAVAALSGLLFGFDTAVVNGGLLLIRSQFHLTNLQAETAAAAMIAGAVFGAASAGWCGDRYGRKKMLGWTAFLFAASSIGAALPSSIVQFELARFVGGVGIGLGSTLAPVYISEIAEPSIRGRLVTLNQLAVVLGILGSYFLCWGLSRLGPGAWRWMFGAGLVPALALFAGLFFIPESPRWLTKEGRTAEANQVLTAIAGQEGGTRDFKDIQAALSEEQGAKIRLSSPELRKPLMIAITLAVLQQFTGINTVLYYGAVLFSEHMHQKTSLAIGVNVVIGLVNVIGTVLSIVWMDRVGRRSLLLWSLAGMAASLFVLTGLLAFHHVSMLLVTLSILAYVTCFAIGPGPVTWVYISEIFPSTIRGRAVSIAIVALWIACLLVTVSFLSLLHYAGPSGAFGLYAALSVAAYVFVYRALPETRGKSLEEISTLWRPKSLSK